MISTSRAPSRNGRIARRFLDAAHDLVFHHVHGGKLIYNACWEDPRIDRKLMQLGADSRVVMITSAGCNSLDYLLDGPAEIHAIDVNHRQNAVLELKLALIAHGAFADLFEFFGTGSHFDFRRIHHSLRSALTEKARAFWDRNITFFSPDSLRKSFYYQGTAGSAAWLMGAALFKSRPNLRRHALSLLDATSLEEQREIYAVLEGRIWSKLTNWLVRQRALMTLLGVPEPQARLIKNSHPGGLTSYVKDKLRHVMTSLPIGENYFWRVYMTGSYTQTCCPNYLRRENFETLRTRVSNVHTHTCTVSEFLRKNPGCYSHYVLLDHQDWLAWHDPAALNEEWDLIFANSRSGTKILLRSAGLDLSFVPAAVRERLRFDTDATDRLHKLDRVGTYGSLHFAEVR